MPHAADFLTFALSNPHQFGTCWMASDRKTHPALGTPGLTSTTEMQLHYTLVINKHLICNHFFELKAALTVHSYMNGAVSASCAAVEGLRGQRCRSHLKPLVPPTFFLTDTA